MLFRSGELAASQRGYTGSEGDSDRHGSGAPPPPRSAGRDPVPLEDGARIGTGMEIVAKGRNDGGRGEICPSFQAGVSSLKVGLLCKLPDFFRCRRKARDKAHQHFVICDLDGIAIGSGSHTSPSMACRTETKKDCWRSILVRRFLC